MSSIFVLVEVMRDARAFAELGPRRRGYCIADNWLVRGADLPRSSQCPQPEMESNTGRSANVLRDRERNPFVQVCRVGYMVSVL